MNITYPGTIRLLKSGQAVIKTKKTWKKLNQSYPNIQKIIKLYKKNKALDILIDAKNERFLKGQLSPEGQIQGARILYLPDGKKLDKAFSLFAKDLHFHDQKTNAHWDVIFQNKGGTYAYCYTLEKKEQHTKKKYQTVAAFEKKYKTLVKNVTKALKDPNDSLALAIYTLLKTYMRVGNQMYYKAHGHKGLTTLTKSDIRIKNKEITFNYLAKDGVPRLIKQTFPKTYTERLKKELKKKKANDFVFTQPNGHAISENHFQQAFKKYTGQTFYPHIIRSHYATMAVKNFIKAKRKISKEEKNKLYLSIAKQLGHQKFVKKENKWTDNYTVTVHHYIDPQLVEKVEKLAMK